MAKLRTTPHKSYVPTVYLESTDPDAFKDMEIKTPKNSYIPNPVLCPVCQGYGGWHLKLDAYGEGKHFDCHCSQCNGWGYVPGDSKSATCIHTFSDRTIGNCLHEWKCTKCGEIRVVDTSG